jgi:hypothetical protein
MLIKKVVFVKAGDRTLQKSKKRATYTEVSKERRFHASPLLVWETTSGILGRTFKGIASMFGPVIP